MRFSRLVASASARLACCVLVLVAACGEPAKLPRLPNDAVVLAFGDSLTFGTGAGEVESYPAQLAQRIGRTVVRAGVPGEVSAAGLARLPEALDEHQPGLLILCHGGNDFLRRMDKRQTAGNLRAMIELAKNRGIAVVLMGTPEAGFTLTPPEFYAELARQFKLPYEGGIIGKVLRDASLKSDPIHPNAQGYRLIAERLAELLRKSGAV
jgi:lysophospholipase L1-like esterase